MGRAEYLAAIAGMGIAGWAVAGEGGRTWRVGSGERSEVSGHVATEGSESETTNTAGILAARRLGASGWALVVAAADFHGS